MSKTNANRLICSANVIENLTPVGVIQPTSERQARPLTRLSAPLQKEVWEKVVETAPEVIHGQGPGKTFSAIRAYPVLTLI